MGAARWALALAALLSLAPAGAAGEDAPEDRLAKEVATLLQQVASDDFSIREAARARLQTLARPARALLEARRDDPDPEVRRTIEALLGPPAAPEAPAGTLGALGLVTFSGQGPLEEVLRQWERSVGGRVVSPPSARGVAVEAKAESAPYFQVLSSLLAAGKLDVADGFDDAGVAAAEPVDPAAHAVCSGFAGPFRVDLVSVQTTRTIRPGPRTRLALGLSLLWSPEVDVVSYTMPTLVRAADAEGRPFRGVDADGAIYGHGGSRRASLTLTLEPPSGDPVEKIDAL